ncbi:MAG: caspase family protein [Candidatus Latescibacteria bacterium]|nr:caspase family protein [Candidatus Latescibacterota bacterium]
MLRPYVIAIVIGLIGLAGCAGPKTISFLAYQPPDFDVSQVRTIAFIGLKSQDDAVSTKVGSLLVQSLMRHQYFTVVQPDRASTRLAGGAIQDIAEAGRMLGVDAVIDGDVDGGVDDDYTMQSNSKRVLVRYDTVTEYESRTVQEIAKVRVKEGGKWVEKTKKVNVVKRVPKQKQVPVYKHVAYTERFLNRSGFVSVNLRFVEAATGNILASRSASRRVTRRKLVFSDEPPDLTMSGESAASWGVKLLATLIASVAVMTVEQRLSATIPDRSELLQSLSAEVARELADQVSPRQVSVVRRLKTDKETKTGVKFARNGQWDQAGREWRRALERKPESAAVWNNLGVFYEHAGQYTEAKQAYQKAVELKSSERLYRLNLASLTQVIGALQKQTASLGAKVEETSLGLLVASILDGTVAERLGLRKGDIIVRVNRKAMSTMSELEQEVIETTRQGGELAVEVMRAGESVSLSLALASGKSRIVAAPAKSRRDRPDVSSTSLPVVDVDEVVSSKTQRPDALGVILGIEDYRYAPAVPYARHDATVVREYFIRTLGLKESNIYVRMDRDATQGEFRKVFDPEQGWLAKRIKPEQTEVFIYYIGHGVPDLTTRDAYLVPSDGDPNYTPTNYRLDELYRNLNQLPARQVTVILDACFSGRVGRGDQVELLLAGARGIAVEPRRVELGGRVIVLTASSGNQVSSSYPEKSHGVFTYFLLKGLKGDADKDEDSTITVRELYAYVREHVTEQAGRLDREQTPELQGDDVDRVLVRY